MRITVLNGSPRNKDGMAILQELKEHMETATFDYIHIGKHTIQPCRGCMLCFSKCETLCPCQDDVQEVVQRLQTADGLIFISPVYAMQISGTMKVLVDRLSYLFHRPALIGKPALTIVTTGGGGQKETQRYLKMMAAGWGAHLVGELTVISPVYFPAEPYYKAQYASKVKGQIGTSAEALRAAVLLPQLPEPSLYQVAMFHGLKSKTMTSEADYAYWEEKGWLTAPYYYDTRLGLYKRIVGWGLDRLIHLQFKRMFQ